MDKGTGEKRSRWDWLPIQMPGVSRLLAEKRLELGASWVDECWRRGVVRREPGWFFACEGALMVGVLGDDAAVLDLVRFGQPGGLAVVVLRNKET